MLSLVLRLALGCGSLAACASPPPPWLDLAGSSGPGAGKRIVLVSGDEEYRSEEALPQLARILAARHGFTCRVLFAVDPRTGAVDPEVKDNIPGLEALDTADLLVIATRFRDLPGAQMQHIADYIARGGPVVGLRTATHAFQIPPGKRWSHWDWRSTAWDGGFGRQILGETWIAHHGEHGVQSTRGVIAPGAAEHPITRGMAPGSIWGATDVYEVRMPMLAGCTPLVLGQALAGMRMDDAPAAGPVNDPMLPIAWTRSYRGDSGGTGRVFTTTLGAATDLIAEGTRRMLVQACYWALDMEDRIPVPCEVELVGEYRPRPFGFGGYARGCKPAER